MQGEEPAAVLHEGEETGPLLRRQSAPLRVLVRVGVCQTKPTHSKTVNDPQAQGVQNECQEGQG